MKAWIVRIVSLYVFNVVMLFVIGFVVPKVTVGWNALWGAVILTVATIWIKPLIGSFFRRAAERRGAKQSAIVRKLIEYVSVYAVALACWFLVVLLSGVRVQAVVPSLIAAALLLVGWVIYDLAIDDVMERVAARAYDRVTGGRASTVVAEEVVVSTPEQRAATEVGRRELNDGLTDEQRKLLDDLN